MSDNQVDNIIEFLKNIVGDSYVSVSIFERIASSLDPFPYMACRDNLPCAVALPESKEQISRIIKYANSEKIPVFIRGSGTQLAGSSRPHTSGIVINTRRMNKVNIFEECGYFECEPGARCGEIAELIEEKGYILPVWVGSKNIASIGGIISNDASSHVADSTLGRPSDYVLGLEVVLPTGEIIETGTKGLRKPAGTDLTRYFTGGDGILGVIVGIRMKLVPMLKEAYGLVVFDDLESVAITIQKIYSEKCPLPLLMEFMSKEAVEIGFKAVEMQPINGHILLSMAVGQTQEEADFKIKEILKAVNFANPIKAELIKDKEEWNRLFIVSQSISSYIMQVTGNKIITSEIVSSLEKIVDAMRDIRDFHKDIPILEECPNIIHGHIGNLTLHSASLLPNDWDDERFKQVTDAVFKKEAELNIKYGTCGTEWGQFSKRKVFFGERYGQDAYNLMMRIKSAFDPNNILNPGILEGYR